MAENVLAYRPELAKELKGKDLRPGVEGLFNIVIEEMDCEIGEIPGLSDGEAETVRRLVTEYAGRLARARSRSRRAGGSEEAAAIEAPKKAKARKKKGEGQGPR